MSYWFGKGELGALHSVLERIPIDYWAHYAVLGPPDKALTSGALTSAFHQLDIGATLDLSRIGTPSKRPVFTAARAGKVAAWTSTLWIMRG